MSVEVGIENYNDFINVLELSAITNKVYLTLGRDDMNCYINGPYLKFVSDSEGVVHEVYEGYNGMEVILFKLMYKQTPRIKVFNGLSSLASCGVLSSGSDSARNHPLLKDAYMGHLNHFQRKALKK